MKGNIKDGVMQLHLVREGVRWLFVVDVATSVVLSETALGPAASTPGQHARLLKVTEEDQRITIFFLPGRPCPFPGLEALHAEFFSELEALRREHDGSCPPCKEGELMRTYKARILQHPAYMHENRPVVPGRAS